jgi:hypothetical protein
MNATPRGRAGPDGDPDSDSDSDSGRSPEPRLPLYRNPLRLLFSASVWRAAWFLIAYIFVVGWVLFAAGFTAAVTAAAFAVTMAGFPLLIAAAAVLRWCAGVERARLRRVLAEPVRAGYRPSRPGWIAEAKARWQDPATWHDVAYTIGLWIPLFVLETAVVSVWLTLLAGVTLPAWYWAPRRDAILGYSSAYNIPGVTLGYFPHGPHGPGALGLYVDTLPAALLAGAGFLVLFLLFNYVLVRTARAHAWAARSLLRAPADPLARAKEVLAGPGPLGPLTTRIQNGGSPVSHQP